MKLSVVVPIYNEKENVPLLVDELRPVLASVAPNSFEIIAVDDGSIDGTHEELLKQAKSHRELKVITFARNYGQTAALDAGLKKAEGEIIVTIDSDLENDPRDIPKLLELLDKGFDLASGWRKGRWENQTFSRKIPSIVANALISKVGGVKLHDYGCTLKAYRKEVITDLPLYGDMHRFIPIYVSRNGGKVTEMQVNYRPRRFGASKYGFSRTGRVFLDLFFIKFVTKYMNRPMHFFGGLGLLSLLAGSGFGLWAIILKLTGLRTFVSTPLPILAALCVIVAVQLVVLGVVSEVLMRIYYESQKKNPYRVKSTVNFS